MMSLHQNTLFLFLILMMSVVNASIHDYSDKPFTHRSDGFIFDGGSKGLFASSSSSPDANPSFIWFENVTFTRPKESVSNHQGENNTGLVEAIILEMKEDRLRIRGSDLICCDSELAKNHHCNHGEVVVQKNPNNPELTKLIKTFF